MRARASLALLLTVTGCTTTHTIPKAELARLDGLHAGRFWTSSNAQG